MTFELTTPSRIIFGAGSFGQAAQLAKELGKRALIVTGHSTPSREPLSADLARCGVASVLFQVKGEPTTDLVRAGVQLASSEKCDSVIGLGGGSVIDASKAIAALLTNNGDLFEHLEVIGQGKPLTKPAAPSIAIPTTAGAGAEVTRNAVLASPEHRVKASLRSALLLPKIALIDPRLTYSLPPALTASTGLDALTQLIEPFVSLRANPVTDGFCTEGMRRVARSLEHACEHGHDSQAREDMAFASLLGGLSLANAGLGAVHGFAAPIGGMFPAPHGAVCAALLPPIIEINLRALRQRQPEHEALRRYNTIAGILTGNPQAMASDGVDWIRALTVRLSIPPLRTYGIAKEHFSLLVQNAAQASSMKANPIPLTREELEEALERAF